MLTSCGDCLQILKNKKNIPYKKFRGQTPPNEMIVVDVQMTDMKIADACNAKHRYG